MQDGPQKRVGRAPAPAARWFIWKEAQPELSPLLKDLTGGMPHSAAASRQASMISQRTRGSSTRIRRRPVAIHRAVLVVLQPLEHRQHLVPGPVLVAERRPVVVVLLLAAHVDHGVDRGAAAQHAPARVMDRAAREVLVGRGLVAPVGARIGDGVEVADRDVDPEPVVLAARLQQQHRHRRIGRQPVGEQAAGAARAGDHVVVAAEDLVHRADSSRRRVRTNRAAGCGCGRNFLLRICFRPPPRMSPCAM